MVTVQPRLNESSLIRRSGTDHFNLQRSGNRGAFTLTISWDRNARAQAHT
jgi:hypothetical protein